MKNTLVFLYSLICSIPIMAQTNNYRISFDNAVHHEAQVTVTFPELTSDTLAVRMSRSSPGRYALHEFAKNVYAVEAKDGNGKSLEIIRPDPYQWLITGYDDTVSLTYTLYANRGDGTYSQIDETHAHLNMPATFMYAPDLKDRKIEIDFKIREDLGWKVATQLPLISGTVYTAPNLYYFMDSPAEISNHQLLEFQVDTQNVRLALHHTGTAEAAKTYFEKVKKVVLKQKEVFGELPVFDYATYTFLACYVPNASGDGMEHRNSTILTSTRSLENGGMERNIGTVSHEFFHAWNVERIRPKALEPFYFDKANMSGELWFAEGFTSYYTNLILCRAGIISPTQYVSGLAGTFNYVWNSPARQFFNPIEMSYQAPFVDAATSVDPVNRTNTFISYYSYGSVLGLALDLALRANNLHLDGYMKLVWEQFGKKEIPYTIENLQNTLKLYAGNSFGDHFFNNYIYGSQMPDYESLFKTVGVLLKQGPTTSYFGATVTLTDDYKAVIRTDPKIGSPAYIAGLNKGDSIIKVNGKLFENEAVFKTYIQQFNVGEAVTIDFERYGEKKSTILILMPDPTYSIALAQEETSTEILKNRKAWLKSE